MRQAIFKKRTKGNDVSPNRIPSALQVLNKDNPFVLTTEERADLTITCKDAEYIPKVKDAGMINKSGKYSIQLMHNGLIMKRGGYYGGWMERIIRELHGHHEPQEEKVFYEILKRVEAGSSMIELGSFWSYYSLWFNKAVKDATNICCEPDINNLAVGKINADLNNSKITFVNSAAGDQNGAIIDFPLESSPGELKKVPIISVDELVKKYSLKKLDILHMDVQGHELTAIRGAERTIKSGKLRFIIVSTHHFSISGDPLTHFKCQKLIESLGGHIIANHTIVESFSGDGLLAASFSPKDKVLHIDVSINSTRHSIYRPYEYDLAELIESYENLKDQYVG